MRRIFCSALILLFLATGRAAAQPALQADLQWGGIYLYQGELLDSLLPEVDLLSDYIGRLKREAANTLSAAPDGDGVSGVLFVAVRPGRHARVWVLAKSGHLSRDTEAALELRLSAMAPVEVGAGFLFGLSFGAWGAAPYDGAGPPPLPPEWVAQIPPEGVMLNDAFIERVWPD
ncbi:MAG TPA: hypothetical protein DHW63_01745 [Hyphomonadaceae bacterium]|nr:hypothetical protein [Hyphomonadaceae bacterium]